MQQQTMIVFKTVLAMIYFRSCGSSGDFAAENARTVRGCNGNITVH
jgi:hypothetical protein